MLLLSTIGWIKFLCTMYIIQISYKDSKVQPILVIIKSGQQHAVNHNRTLNILGIHVTVQKIMINPWVITDTL